MQNDKQEKVIEQFQKALEAAKQAQVSGEICVSVKLYQGGIKNGHLTIQREVV
jgi:hypothetical protein